MKTIGRERRHKRITKKMKGSAEQPRLAVFRSQKHIYAQLINDQEAKVITSYSTLADDFKQKKIKSADKEAARQVGKLVAERALSLGITKVCFDRSGFKYHGRVEALAQGVREAGLKF